MKKHAVIISCFDHYERMIYWDQSAQDLGYWTTYIAADFSHGAKTKYVCPVKGCKQIHVMPYRKNLSIQRVLSHHMFAKKLYEYLIDEQPEIVISLIPPNFITKYLAKFKKKHPECKVVFDIYDLWPESFPSSGLKKILAPAFRVWGNLRNNYLPAADYVTAECGMYLDRLQWHKENARVIYFSLPPYQDKEEPLPSLPTDRAEIAYLGSINNIIDIDKIVAILAGIAQHMPTTLHVIGDGESREQLCERTSAAGVHVVFHGKIFDEDQKHKILSGCHFGLNIMKDSVCIGLTMKSVDYLRHGLPLINNIPHDTKDFIEQYHAGIHFRTAEQTIQDACHAIYQDNTQMHHAAIRLFRENFDSKIHLAHCTQILKEI